MHWCRASPVWLTRRRVGQHFDAGGGPEVVIRGGPGSHTGAGCTAGRRRCDAWDSAPPALCASTVRTGFRNAVSTAILR
jgi:hypothetical protein